MYFGVFGSLYQNANKIAPEKGRQASWQIKDHNWDSNYENYAFSQIPILGLLYGTYHNCG